MRVRSRWYKKDKAASIEEIAGALAFIAWRIGQSSVNKMYNAGFNYRSNVQQLAVIGEILIFLIQVADRLAYNELEEGDRVRFVTELAQRLAGTLADNMSDEAGPGDYRTPFIERLNERAEAYAEFSFMDGEPSYPFLRYLGTCVDQLMGGQENKWVVEQVTEVEAPAAVKTLRRAFNNLLEGKKPEAEDEAGIPA
jgi:hypothetical protein